MSVEGEGRKNLRNAKIAAGVGIASFFAASTYLIYQEDIPEDVLTSSVSATPPFGDKLGVNYPKSELISPQTIHTSKGDVEFGEIRYKIPLYDEAYRQIIEKMKADHNVDVSGGSEEQHYGIWSEEDIFSDEFLELHGNKDEANISAEVVDKRPIGKGLGTQQMLKIGLVDYSQGSYVMIKRKGEEGEDDNYFLNYDFLTGFRRVGDEQVQPVVESYLVKNVWKDSPATLEGNLRIVIFDVENQKIAYNDVTTQ